MDTIRESCPHCHNPVLYNLGSLPLAQGSMVFEIVCPHCDAPFRVGYAKDLTVVWSDKLRKDEAIRQRRAEAAAVEAENATSGSAGGGGGGFGRSPSGNDQRSNTLNPNNSANRAASNNRSNQMNPNSSAYRSSRGGRGRGR